jgi:oligogalacturonide lyase
MAPQQGPDAGRELPPEAETFVADTGVTVRRVTDSRAHDHHAYFTELGWWDDGRRLLFGSDRTGSPNLFSVHLETGVITQCSDFQWAGAWNVREEYSFPFQTICTNPDRPEVYVWWGDELIAIHLESLTTRSIYEKASDENGADITVTADGGTVVTSIHEQSEQSIADLFAARPRSRIVSLPVDGGTPRVLHEEDHWISHLNASPTRPDVLLFCHEGPWSSVDQRMWGLDRETEAVWKIRPQTPEEAIGHEYWLQDGETIGYEGTVGEDHVFGFTSWDNSDRVEAPSSIGSNHFHSNTRDRIVGDGNPPDRPDILLWGWDGDTVTDPRRLVTHGGSAHVQGIHVHPRFSPDGETVCYTSDTLGYGNVYLADVPEDTGTLPTVDVG